ncbi:MAG: hypothetical protein J5636_05740 [Clostridiales bacterium]|nr:hypothetical protein [Clostridiales bacterium]
MPYKIISGRYESGTEEQKAGYRMLFGEENIQYNFDLYFHFYNIAHEFGHCLLDQNKIEMDKVKEEMYVNRLAVAFWRFAGRDDRIEELRALLDAVLGKIPSRVPPEHSFESFFRSIWGTETLNNVMLYGYFQLKSVLLAIDGADALEEVLHEQGFHPDFSRKILPFDEKVHADSSAKVLEYVIRSFESIGITPPEVTLELVDNPMIQCAQ